MWVQAWTGLIAVDWDALDYTKWNELVNKVLPIESDGTNVWIWTASPTRKLHVATTSASGAARFTAATAWESTIEIETTVGWWEADIVFLESGTEKWSILNQNGWFEFWSKPSGTWQENMILSENGNLTVTGSIDASPVIFLWKWPGNPYQIGWGNPAIWTQDINLWWFTLQNGGTEVKVPSDGYYRIHTMMHLKDDPADAGWTWLWISKNGSNSTQSLYPTNSNWATHHLTNIMYLTTTDVITIPYAGTREAQQQFSKLIIEKIN